MTDTELYIFKFSPILKEKLWGGTKLMDKLGKSSMEQQIGESWEISDVEGDCSIVQEGALQGKTLRNLVETYKDKLVGKKNYNRFGNKFPLLIKFIDAKKDLSVQLHPDDTIAKQKHDSFGKTEMWHIVQADQNAAIIVGFKGQITKAQYQHHVQAKTIEDVLNRVEVKPGDTFFVYPGLIHAIGAGVLLAEIQQTSDVTYRIYDWDRKDKNGKTRELHQEEALEAIDFKTKDRYDISYRLENNKLVDLVSCPYFITNIIKVNEQITISHVDLDSFVIYMCVEGEAIVKMKNSEVFIQFGETILVPAVCNEIEVISKEATLLQTYI